jgi:hypothetical protein
MNLIKVTRYNGNHDVCYVRLDSITGVCENSTDKCTMIYDGTNSAYYVRETVEQVLSTIKRAVPCNVMNVVNPSEIA